jgi:hypothetical protein
MNIFFIYFCKEKKIFHGNHRHLCQIHEIAHFSRVCLLAHYRLTIGEISVRSGLFWFVISDCIADDFAWIIICY